MDERSERAQLEWPGRVGVRVKVLALVVTAALAPALLVGVASYLTAETILLEKTNGQLGSRTQTVVGSIESWLAERRQDVGIFASSFMVTQALSSRSPGGSTDASASARIRAYLPDQPWPDQPDQPLTPLRRGGSLPVHGRPQQRNPVTFAGETA